MFSLLSVIPYTDKTPLGQNPLGQNPLGQNPSRSKPLALMTKSGQNPPSVIHTCQPREKFLRDKRGFQSTLARPFWRVPVWRDLAGRVPLRRDASLARDSLTRFSSLARVQFDARPFEAFCNGNRQHARRTFYATRTSISSTDSSSTVLTHRFASLTYSFLLIGVVDF